MQPNSYSAVSQILNDNFFQNPAELSLIKKIQLIGGSAYLIPKFKFTGTSYGKTGSAYSTAYNFLPYLLSGYRLNDRFVFGINITPSSYGHLSWPMNSVVSQATTLTDVIYYRVGAQTSYQFTSKLALGFGLNLEYNKQVELNYLIAGLGNQVNRASAKNFTADIGLFYKINARNFLTMAAYSQVKSLAYGTSSLGMLISKNYSMTISQAPVAYIGLQHILTDKWLIGEKIYWSGWSIQNFLAMNNTTTGSSVTPNHWKDVWTFQLSTRYATSERLALLAFANYDTNPIDAIYNQVGYPLAPFGALAAGLDVNINDVLSTQLVAGYGTFIPKAKIINAFSVGVASLAAPSFTLQFTYKS